MGFLEGKSGKEIIFEAQIKKIPNRRKGKNTKNRYQAKVVFKSVD